MTILNISTKSWPQKAVVYQIYPRSFKDSNNDGIGDLQGIIEKLDYLNDGTENSLGVDTIWLSPIYKSPMVDFGYDVADYTDIDPIFGNLHDFEILVKEAHRRHIRIMMDFIGNHTSILHTWFQQSRSSRKNDKRDWYIWQPARQDGCLPNNWVSVFGGSAWEYDEQTDEYYLHTFTKDQPDLNWHNPEVREAMLGVLKFWLEKGVDGFRADAVEYLIKDKQLRDEPLNPSYKVNTDNPYNQLEHIYTRNQPEIHEIVRTFAATLNTYGEKFMVNEVNADLDELIAQYNSNDGLCIPFNFHLMNLPWDAEAFKTFVDKFDSSLGSFKAPNYVLGNHDVPRLATRLGKDKARLSAMLQLTLRGIPFIYYGEELGMENGIIPPEKVQDPFEKRVPGMNLGRDPSRTPMPWQNDKYAGFSEVEPWLPIYDGVKVDESIQNTQSMFHLYKKLIHTRKNSDALLHGHYVPVELKNKGVFAFIRRYMNEKIMIVLNFSDKEQTISYTGKGKVICNTHLDKSHEMDLHDLNLRPTEGYVISLQE